MKKRTVIFAQQTRAFAHYFLPNGLARYYILDCAGREYTKSLRQGPTFLGSSSVTHEMGVYPFTAEIIHASSLYALDIGYWKSLQQNSSFLKFYMQYMAGLFCEKEKRELAFLLHSVKDRYLQFKKDFIAHLPYIPKWMIASYLGITPEALSRIIKRINLS